MQSIPLKKLKLGEFYSFNCFEHDDKICFVKRSAIGTLIEYI